MVREDIKFAQRWSIPGTNYWVKYTPFAQWPTVGYGNIISGYLFKDKNIELRIFNLKASIIMALAAHNFTQFLQLYCKK